MFSRKSHFCIITIFIFFFVISSVIRATDKQKIRVKTHVKNTSLPPRKYETQEEREKRLRKWEMADKAKQKLQEMQDRKREKFEAKQKELKQKKLAEDSIKTAESYEKKIALLERKVARLDKVVKRLETRVNLLETIILDKDPVPLAEPLKKEQLEQNEKAKQEQ